MHENYEEVPTYFLYVKIIKKCLHTILNFAFWSAKPKIVPVWPFIEKRIFQFSYKVMGMNE